MSNFAVMLNNMPEYFDKYYQQIITALELDSLTDQEKQLVEYVVHQMFLDAINTACSKALSPEELAKVEVFLDFHPEATLLDIYFAAASHKDNIDELIALELQNAVTDAKKLYNELEA
ncbi:hypothetical protein HOH51_01165 [bacterium]|jgi:hypothetical protein|nr:hypothetical protein [bacterium]